MDFPINDEKLKAASSNLTIYLMYAVRVLNWHSWEKLKVKDEAKREKVTASFDRMENKVRESFPNADEILNNSFHVFAAKSDLYSFESVAPPSNPFIFIEEYDEIIGTSAHHACVCFLRRCLRTDFWKDNQSVMDRWKSELLPKLNQNQLQKRMYWERMRVFETSDFGVNHNYEGIPTTDQMIAAEDDVFDMARRKMKIGDQEAEFSPVPFKLIHYLYNSKTQSASFEELRKNVWKNDVGDRGILSAKDKCNKALLDAGLCNIWVLSGSDSSQHIAMGKPHK
ncbi:hypothetical protein [Gimesia maris]|uniref:hypothetical protein n=1 Tax=Gimesia maris TaxID=122 RepID=UPI0030D82E96|tara:strand:- start:2399 stop:3244 length:846 start_codon:yes stop_codon:yes gene_type:complete